MDEEKLLTDRFRELSQRAETRNCRTFSEFLSLSEQGILQRAPLASSFSLVGGYDSAERRIAVFTGSDCYYEEEPPIRCVEMKPLSQKFADALSHRDFLGSLMALGIRRELLGDILIHENVGYLFCLASISDFLIASLTKVRHTDVVCSVVDAPPSATTVLPDPTRIVVSSERLDALIAAAFKLSRSEAQELFKKEKVFVNGKLIQCDSDSPKSNEIVSVRGLGRFLYEGVSGETKKGRLTASVRIFK